jgi:hypothetical protein
MFQKKKNDPCKIFLTNSIYKMNTYFLFILTFNFGEDNSNPSKVFFDRANPSKVKNK